MTSAFRQPRRAPAGARRTGGGKLCSAPEARGSTCPRNATGVARAQRDQRLRVDAPSQASLSQRWPECLEASGPWPNTSMHGARACVLPVCSAALCIYVLHDAPCQLPCPKAGLNAISAYADASLNFLQHALLMQHVTAMHVRHPSPRRAVALETSLSLIHI